ncbi:hypothetical protein DIPPA_23548 [Diplonema papillatum]|nr:hypothetical protein DIPPA_23548 [Diplonema papillatum]|eukprot:gene11465-17636_t
MSFNAPQWSDEETPAVVVGAEVVVKKKRKLLKKATGPAKKASIKKLAGKRRRDEDEDEEMDDAANDAPEGNGAKRYKDSAGKSRKRQLPPAPPAPPGVGVFHTIMDPAFSNVAVAEEGRDTRAGAWIGSQCKCLQCETTRVAQQLVKHEINAVVLLDLDNFGFPHWIKHAAPPSFLATDDAQKKVFVWGFYGLGFETHGLKGDPWDAIVSRSVFGHLRKGEKLRLTPCANTPQAADEAIQRMILVLRNMHIAVVSGDKLHLKQSAKNHAAQELLPGRRRKIFRTINSLELLRDSQLIWGSVSNFVAKAAAADAEDK